MNSRFKKLKWNSILALIYQLILVVTGFILPRLFLRFYGSEVYGLTTSITQFLSFINLCDMGVTGVVSAALYGPLARRDKKEISEIVVYARKFFDIIGFILLVYVIVLILAYPTFVANSFSLSFTITLILAMSISQFGQYFIGITNQILLNADQKSYVQLLINGSTLILNTITSIVIMYIGGSIQLVKLLTSLIYLIRPILMKLYVRKKYDIDYSIKTSGKVIPEKWNGVIQHISYMIYQNTDVIVLTMFSTLSNVSIYSVYVLVVSSIKAFINAATTGIQALFGNMLANGEVKELRCAFDIYDWIIHTVASLLFTITGELIVPFVMIYSSGVNDAEYNAPVFAALITLAYGVIVLREGMYVLIRAAGYFRRTQTAAMFEAIINLTLSLLLVFHFGLIGVALGTLIAASFFLVYEVYYFSSNILCRSAKKFIKQILVDVVQVFFMVMGTQWINVAEDSYFHWGESACLVGIICISISALIQIIFYRPNMNMMISYIKNRFLRKHKKRIRIN